MLLVRAASAFVSKPVLRSWNYGRPVVGLMCPYCRSPAASANNEATIVTEKPAMAKNFIVNTIEEDIKSNRHGGKVLTRFPPEPNGYLHLGHAKSINLNFGIAKAFGGVTNMRFDDTNPAKEDMEYVRSILEDVRWLLTGDVQCKAVPWDGEVRHASDYFQVIYDAAEYLIKNGMAYVDELTPDEVKEYRGTLTEPGKDSPYRTRSIEDNLTLFRKMREGAFADGHCVLRGKIDMSSGNMNMRDPTLFRIKHGSHPITGDKWCIYPMYDFAHAISDALEGITHSLCTLEFEAHRPLYDWTIDSLLPSGLLPHLDSVNRPRQYEFSRLNMQYTVLSKRKLITLVSNKLVSGTASLTPYALYAKLVGVIGWDDPRMPTICGLRRRGVPHSALQLFCQRIGISKSENNIELSVLEDCCREVLDGTAGRIFAIQQPLKVTISNYPEGSSELFPMDNHPRRPELGSRELSFENSLYIDRADFFDTGVDGTLVPPKGFKRLLPGGSIRLKYAYVLTCTEVLRDAKGEVCELICTYDASSKHGAAPQHAKKPKGIIQWIAATQSIPMQLRLYDRLFTQPMPGKDQDFLLDINADSLQIVDTGIIEKNVLALLDRSNAHAHDAKNSFQFERMGYFSLDRDSAEEQLVFNRIVTLRDTWANK